MMWNTEVILSKESCEELSFWSHDVDSLNFLVLGDLCRFQSSSFILMHAITLVDFPPELEFCRKFKKLHMEEALNGRSSTICLCP